MHADAPVAVLAAMSKHQEAGTVAVVVGALLIVLGVARVMRRATKSALLPLVGVGAVVLGVLLFARVF